MYISTNILYLIYFYIQTSSIVMATCGHFSTFCAFLRAFVWTYVHMFESCGYFISQCGNFINPTNIFNLAGGISQQAAGISQLVAGISLPRQCLLETPEAQGTLHPDQIGHLDIQIYYVGIECKLCMPYKSCHIPHKFHSNQRVPTQLVFIRVMMAPHPPLLVPYWSYMMGSIWNLCAQQ